MLLEATRVANPTRLLCKSRPAISHRRVENRLSVLWNLAMIGGSMLGGALMDVALGLPFAIVGLLNVAAIALSVSFFRLVDVQKNRLICAVASD